MLEMGPDLTQAYFWPAVNKRPTHNWPRIFWPSLKRFFLIRSEKNCDFQGKFSKSKLKPKMADPTQPSPSNKKSTRSGSQLNIDYFLYREGHHWVSDGTSADVTLSSKCIWEILLSCSSQSTAFVTYYETLSSIHFFNPYIKYLKVLYQVHYRKMIC